MAKDLLLSKEDRDRIECLVYDPSLEPGFDALKSCLIWRDEVPSGVTPDGYKTVCELWVARAFLYHGFALPDLFDPNYFQGVWDRAIAEGLKWPGFNRLSLSEKDKAYYEQMLAQENPF